MKKLVIALIIPIALLLLATVIFAEDAAQICEASGTVLRGTCQNHNFEFSGYSPSQKQHTYSCSNSGCTAYLVEECYFWGFCGNYAGMETVPCQRCGNGALEIHNYAPTHVDFEDEGYTHGLICMNMADTWQCCRRKATVDCTLETTQIWRGFERNHGHILTRDCSVCEYMYTTGYFYPVNHPNYFSADNTSCPYCQLSPPYHIDYTVD